jgi:hypothetical protein
MNVHVHVHVHIISCMYEDEDEDEDVHDRLQDILTLTLFQRIITYLASEPVRQASRSKFHVLYL